MQQEVGSWVPGAFGLRIGEMPEPGTIDLSNPRAERSIHEGEFGTLSRSFGSSGLPLAATFHMEEKI